MNNHVLKAFALLLLLFSITACSGSPYENGEIAMEDEQYQEAVQFYDQVLQEKPSHGRALRKSGLALYFLDKNPESIARLERSLIVSDHFDTHLYLGMAYLKSDDTEAALQHFKRFAADITSAPTARSKQVAILNTLSPHIEALENGDFARDEILAEIESKIKY